MPRVILFIILTSLNFPAISENTGGFYPPVLSTEEILDYIDLYNNKDKLGLENYNLTKLSYSYNAREWYLSYKDSNDKFKILTILIDDINPSSYEVLIY